MATKDKTELLNKDLPKNWKAFRSKKNNKLFYYNLETKKTQWEHPLSGSSRHQSADDAYTKKSSRKTKNRNDAKRLKRTEKKGKQNEVTQHTNTSKIKSEKLSVTSERASDPAAKSCSNVKNEQPRFQPLPPLTIATKPKNIGCLSEGSTSGTSDRIVAWLQDTSCINFREHPFPNPEGEKQTSDKSKSVKFSATDCSKDTSQRNRERKKAAILERVDTSTASSERNRSSILEKLLPEHPPPSGVKTSRHAPYKSSTNDIDTRQKAQAGISPSPSKKAFVSQTKRTNQPQGNTRFTGEQNIKTKSQTSESGFQIRKKDYGCATVTKSTAWERNYEKTVENEQFRVDRTVPQSEDVLPMDEEEYADVSLPPSESDVADMEIDNAEEFEKEIVQKLQQMRNNLVVDPSNAVPEECGMNIANSGYEGTLYVVLDTNVLLSHLKFVVELKDFPIQGVGRPILVIPWVVIQELDSLKDSKWRTHQNRSAEMNEVEQRVDMLARVAIKFLNSCFQKSDPRVRGQTVDEAAEHVGNLKEESNDDRILQCCLLFKERGLSGNCVLFSNDVNLCNKALVNGIKAFNHQRLIPGLRDLFQCGAIVKQAYFQEYKTQLKVQEEISWRREKADELLCELQIILREGLSYIIEIEMKEAYDDLWQSIVAIKPPWTLIDVLQLLEKHWIAVFGHILKRDQKTVIEELRKKFDDRKGTPSSLLFSSEVLQLGLKIFRAFAAHSNYDEAIPKCLAAVNVLIQKCQQYQASTLNNVSQPAGSQPKCLTQGPANDQTQSVGHTSATISEVHDGIVEGNYALPHEEVMDTFNLIWTAVTQFSAQIFTALGYPNSIPNELAQDLPKASKEEAVQFLGVLCPRLVNLVDSIKDVLRDPWEKASQNDNLFVQLEQAVAVFLKQILSRDNCLSPQKLFGFCQDSSMRTALVQGLSQLDRASAMLQHCASCVAQSGSLQ